MISANEVIKKIKEKGYWDISIHPVAFEKDKIKDRKEAIDLVRESVVELRGWDYPHFTDREGDPHSIQDGIEKFIAWDNHIELWRMYLSGQFIHLLALREDWLTDEQLHRIAIIQEEKVEKILEVTGTVYTLTEIFEFARRLAQKGIFQDEVSIEITLNGIQGRALAIDSSGRIPFLSLRMCQEDQWRYEKTFSVNDLLSESKEIALKAIFDLFELFNWFDAPIQTIKDDQDKFLSGRV
ncbi:hypothetical protein HYT74_02295 [Candidatus Daviesbacteria bacterium]|nr:hypothetical protein [Candidatus Daviesbacteria bacterium]